MPRTSFLRDADVGPRVAEAKLTNFYRIVNDTAPKYLCNIISNCKNDRYNLRNADNLQVPKTRTETFKRSFIPSSITPWNSLDSDIKEVHDLTAFKQKLKKVDDRNLLFYKGARATSIKHAQLRMNCSKDKQPFVFSPCSG